MLNWLRGAAVAQRKKKNRQHKADGPSVSDCKNKEIRALRGKTLPLRVEMRRVKAVWVLVEGEPNPFKAEA